MDNIGSGFRKKIFSKNSVASMPKRFGALVIDLFILNLFILSPFRDIIINFVNGKSFAEIQIVSDHIYVTFLLISLVIWLYFSLLQYYTQQTIGMMIMKIKVTPDPTFFKTLIRNLYVLPIFPLSLLWIIEPIYLYFRGIRLLEKLSKTKTIDTQ